MSEESKCEFCEATLVGFKELSRIEYGNPIEYGKLEALAARGCEACGCLLEAMDYYQNKCPNLYGMTLNTFGPFPPGHQPFILSRHGGRQSEKKLHVDVFTVGEEIGDRDVIRNASHISETYEGCISLLRAWMNSCNESHALCRTLSQRETPLPTRILDLKTQGPGNDLRLVTTDNLSARYMTLSHCWGESQPLITTSENIRQREKNIVFNDLPRTFRDAVTVTREMRIRYLWIDCLCIIQGDKDDWELESSRMADVYSNSYLNIAATKAEDCHGGIFKEWDVRRSWPLRTKTRSGATVFCRESEVDCLDTVQGFRRGSAHQRLLRRGWVFQELLLSPRVILFGRNEILWQCLLEYKCECGEFNKGFHQDRRKDSLDTIELVNAEEWWYGRVENQYCNLELTVASDKLAALSGVATIFSKIIGSEYLAGLWRSHLPGCLMWAAEFPQSRKSLRSITPTWSWVSMDTSYPLLSPPPMETHHSLTIIKTMCQPEGKNPFGQVNEWFIDIRAPFIVPDKIKFIKDSSDFCRVYVDCGGIQFHLIKDEIDYDDEEQNMVQLHPTYLKPDGTLALMLLLVGNTPPTKLRWNGKRFYALVLKDSAHKDGCFERFGIAQAKFGGGVEVTGRHDSYSISSESTSKNGQCPSPQNVESEVDIEMEVAISNSLSLSAELSELDNSDSGEDTSNQKQSRLFMEKTIQKLGSISQALKDEDHETEYSEGQSQFEKDDVRNHPTSESGNDRIPWLGGENDYGPGEDQGGDSRTEKDYAFNDFEREKFLEFWPVGTFRLV